MKENAAHLYDAVVSHITLRRMMGILGIALPIILIVYSVLSSCGVLTSISGYYYSGVRDVFVGILVSLGIFLYTYNGPGGEDKRITNIAAICALMVAFFPTGKYAEAYFNANPCLRDTEINEGLANLSNIVHHIGALGLFIILGYISLYLFTMSDKPKAHWGPKKRSKNKIFSICGWIIFGCIGLLILNEALNRFAPDAVAGIRAYNPVLVLETIALWAFGTSWLVKGELIFGGNEEVMRAA